MSDSESDGEINEYQHLVHSAQEEEQIFQTPEQERQFCPPLTLKNATLICCGVVALSFIVAILAFLSGMSRKTLVDVVTECGVVRGYHSNIAYSFKAIPYAVPPVGDLRWKPPRGLKEANFCWNGSYDATAFRDMCAQIRPMSSIGKVMGSEDCLHLNVWTPTLDKMAKLPVMVYIHGGCLHVLSGFEKGYHPTEELAKVTNTVYVSLNYRLNAFGFMALELLRKNSAQNISGNYGFMDQIEALRWVKNNILAFGGDPEKVTIFGQSSGGTSVWTLMMSPLAKGLFHRAIDMSGSYIYNKSLEDTEKDNLVFLNKTGCKNLSCLYSLTKEQILQAIPWQEYPYWAVEDLMDIPVKGQFDGAVAVVDGYVVPAPPLEMWKNKSSGYNDVPFVIGTTQQEADYSPTFANITFWSQSDFEMVVKEGLAPFGQDISNDALSLYNSVEICTMTERCFEKVYTTLVSDMRVTCPNNHKATEAAAALSSPVYRYVVTYNPSKEVKELDLLSFHSRFAFHLLDTYGFFGALDYVLGSTTASDRNFSRLLQKYFSIFAKTGKMPDEWGTYPQNIAYLSELLSIKSDYYPDRCALWEKNGFFSYAWIN
ncbi:para-nitrobenzyl esterase-like [Protopterus annectens]|uniref:para-nitrobenzyl esterase-like n=1 Tax=Protopterus annectens TaxID=7888 RepID=UPI001CFAD1E9|nr:para-nitrobenzyl esterase-like [Protopterus annectens]XP_043938619.1 para-nitrobenzyl esterase-like [Protopterus annectens]XP_043938620.1 para-nitrobenzyl esterase-like [Protopterus annectens]XP_043938621.1 para-nitrobenzyl esterase-like [Protopterus annectens]XP_043938622.1 para-nitrobenzyl esterase-like [Protopterus annectens]